MRRPLVVGISGASGVIYGIRLLEVLESSADVETHLVLTKPAERTIAEETPWDVCAVRALATVVHPVGDIGASIASGSFLTMGMVVAPCSIRTASAIAYCQADNLLTRAADVTLKEGRKLVLVPRETPLSPIALENMAKLSRAGVSILPAMPAFYTHPKTLEDAIAFVAGKALDQFGVEHALFKRYGG